jgi:hypothetical protein
MSTFFYQFSKKIFCVGLFKIENIYFNRSNKWNKSASALTLLSVMYCCEQKNSNRQCHFKIWLDCHKLKKNPCLIRYVHVNKMSKKLINQCQLMSYNMRIGYELWYLGQFYNGAFSISSTHDFDDQFFLLTTVQSVGECQMVGGEQFQHLHYILHIVNLDVCLRSIKIKICSFLKKSWYVSYQFFSFIV